ncbi:MAG: flagellar basal-body rod protein FlgG [Nitrospirae bacterium]|nr:flagellar basal-body rod protein FlgG [Candidatus Troglogloeales bacterium]
MMRSLYIATTGMAAQQLSIEVISNNLANVSTTGFKKSAAEFHELLYQTFRPAGSPRTSGVLPVGIQVGLGVQPMSVHKTFRQGDFEQTLNDFDIAIEGDGFFQVTLPDGNTGFTRSGNFKLNNEGAVVTSEGLPLLPAISIPSGMQKISISPEGVVSGVAAGTTTETVIGTMELARFANPAGLDSLGKNLYQVTTASGEALTGVPGKEGFGKLEQGFLESSNVNIAEEMVKMITAQRAYELNSKAIQTSDEMLSLVNNLKR